MCKIFCYVDEKNDGRTAAKTKLTSRTENDTRPSDSDSFEVWKRKILAAARSQLHSKSWLCPTISAHLQSNTPLLQKTCCANLCMIKVFPSQDPGWSLRFLKLVRENVLPFSIMVLCGQVSHISGLLTSWLTIWTVGQGCKSITEIGSSLLIAAKSYVQPTILRSRFTKIHFGWISNKDLMVQFYGDKSF